jgi:hypothetical protein
MSINFEFLNLPIPELILKLSIEQQQDIFNYLNQLNTNNKKAYLIAFNHLGTSFNIYKSNGYKEWKNKMEK